jgi:hypothetical protein
VLLFIESIEHLIGLIRNLYTEQEDKAQVEQGATDWFPVKKGVRQGCILSPDLLSLYSEHIIRTAGLEDIEAGVKMGPKNKIPTICRRYISTSGKQGRYGATDKKGQNQ